MIEAIAGPLAYQPEYWTLVFARRSATRWGSLLACGRYKHVRAYAYVPFLHVWVFYDVAISGTSIVIAADGDAALGMILAWSEDADRIKIRRGPEPMRNPPVFGYCVPSMKRLIGLRSGALRPDALWRDCLKAGGTPVERRDGSRSTTISGPAARSEPQAS